MHGCTALPALAHHSEVPAQQERRKQHVHYAGGMLYQDYG
jgi:hypothetical protein